VHKGFRRRDLEFRIKIANFESKLRISNQSCGFESVPATTSAKAPGRCWELPGALARSVWLSTCQRPTSASAARHRLDGQQAGNRAAPHKASASGAHQGVDECRQQFPQYVGMGAGESFGQHRRASRYRWQGSSRRFLCSSDFGRSLEESRDDLHLSGIYPATTRRTSPSGPGCTPLCWTQPSPQRTHTLRCMRR
jgi:hypothetical protein